MKLEEIEIIIENNGKVRIRTEGFSGNDCLSATEGLENLLGGKPESREMRPEAFEASPRLREEIHVKARRS